MVDHLPIVSDVDSIPGFYICAGHETFTGKQMAHIVMGEDTDFDISSLDFARFAK